MAWLLLLSTSAVFAETATEPPAATQPPAPATSGTTPSTGAAPSGSTTTTPSGPTEGGATATPPAPTAPQQGPPVPPDILAGTPSAAPPATAASGATPRKPLRDNQAELSAKYVKRDGQRDTLFAEGDLHLLWHDLDVTGRRALFDFKVRTGHVDGPIRLTREDGTEFETDSLDILLDKDWYTTGAFRATLSPSLIGHGAVEPFYLRGSDSFSIRDTYFSGHNIVFSSCPPNDLKYAITARTVAVIPNRKLIFRGAKAYLFGLPIFAFGKFVVPLRRFRRTEFLPEFGRNDVYGFFARQRYFYDFATSQFGDVYATVTEKRGVFLGLEHDYGWGRQPTRGDGHLEFEYGTKESELSLRGNLTQNLGRQTELRLNGSYSQNSGFSTTAGQSNVTGQLSHRFDLGATTLGYSRSDTSSAGQFSAFTRYTANQTFTLGQLFNAELNADLSDRQSSTSARDQQLDTRIRLNGGWSLFDWEVFDQRHFDLTKQANGGFLSSVTEVVPQVSLRTDSGRLGLPLPHFLSFRADTNVGLFREPVTVIGGSSSNTTELRTVLRANWDLNGETPEIALGRSLRFRTDMRYNQSFFDYPKPAAKYIVAFGPTLAWQPISHTRIDLRYRWQKVSGYSPLSRFDFAETLNDLDYTVNLFVPDQVRPRYGLFAMVINGGYDLLRGQPRDVSIGAQLQPIDNFMLELNTSYALSGQGYGGAGFRAFRGELRYDGGRGYRHQLGFTYDPKGGGLQNIDSLLTVSPLSRLTIQNALTWDGLNSKVSYNDILVNYSLGCVSLVGTYRQQVKEFRVDLNITAFPGLTSLFGTGRFGQQFSTSQGVSF